MPECLLRAGWTLKLECIMRRSGILKPEPLCTSKAEVIPDHAGFSCSRSAGCSRLACIVGCADFGKDRRFGRITRGSLVLPAWGQADMAYSPAASVWLPCGIVRFVDFAKDGRLGRIACGSLVLLVWGQADVAHLAGMMSPMNCLRLVARSVWNWTSWRACHALIYRHTPTADQRKMPEYSYPGMPIS
ncbi:hypothetical protein Nepgr_027218 [Nepenthes gracilis]|uniref:Uncharacterized protein n=1 Tax=Nepenthes gracilis TaxID=150966 RepID=A0AAD3T9J4_NEPGR|nr:hypothetical protein Nepgr_027218 [Nepenthes gracilis]